MIYSPSTTAALGIVEDAQPEEPLTLRGEGLWVCLISSGKCVVSLSDLELMPAGSALLLPPQNAAAGHLVLSRGPLTLAPENECHLLCVQLTGQAAEQFLAGLSEMPFLARGETCPAAAELTEALGFNIPQRWSIAHFYQALLNGEGHLGELAFFTTLAGYVHWRLTGQKVLGVGDASGMFPIDSATGGYDAEMLKTCSRLIAGHGFGRELAELLPAVLPAGADAGALTAEGARLLDPTGTLQPGVPFCPPEAMHRASGCAVR